MTSMDQTLREAYRPNNSIVTPKDTLVIEHWNVRSLYRGGATAQVAREMEGYKVDILGISECRWTGAGKQRITSGQTLLYVGDEKMNEGGVAIMMSKGAERALMEWTPVRKRIIITARFYSRSRRLLVGNLRSTTATSTKTSPQNITLRYRKFIAVRPSRSRRTMWAKYPKNKLVRAVSE